MKYETTKAISKLEVEAIFNKGVNHQIEKTLVSLAYHHKDWRWVQSICLFYAKNGQDSVKQTAILCFGHLARIHKQLDLNIVIPVLEELKSQNTLHGQIENTLDDIAIYINNSKTMDS